MVEHKFKWSREITFITLSTIAIIIGGGVYVWLSEMSLEARIIMLSILAPIIAISAIWAPRKITIDKKGVKCQLLATVIVIPASEVISIQKCDAKDAFKGCMRLFGSGGLFGYYGVFRNQKLGRFSMYITQRENMILVTTKRKKYIFNCPLEHVDNVK